MKILALFSLALFASVTFAQEVKPPKLDDAHALAIRESQLKQAGNAMQQAKLVIQMRELQLRAEQLQAEARTLEAETAKLIDEAMKIIKADPEKWRLDQDTLKLTAKVEKKS